MNSKALLHLQNDPVLHRVIINTTLPDFNPSGNVYFDLLESIVSQQLSVKVATVIFKRFCQFFPDQYPHAESLLALEHEHLRTAGLSSQKAAYLRNVAAFALENKLENYDWSIKSDAEIIAELSRIKGVGQWTVEMILIFTLDRPDVFPIDDLGIQQAMARLFGLEETGKNLKKRMLELSEPWRPHRSLATRYLWRWKDTPR